MKGVFPRYVCTRVRLATLGARIDGGVSVSLSKLLIVKLAVYELMEGSSLSSVGRETTVNGLSYRLCVRAHLYVF
jgi:hypothetical protein